MVKGCQWQVRDNFDATEWGGSFTKAVPGIGPGAYSMIRKVLYNSGPQGYCGDEDNGQTSPGGKKFVIHAENASEDNCYIRSETLNGKNFSHNF